VTAPSAKRFELPNAFIDDGHGCSIDVGVKSHTTFVASMLLIFSVFRVFLLFSFVLFSFVLFYYVRLCSVSCVQC
jgi:hypothetical protein